MNLRKRRGGKAHVESSSLNDILFIFLLFFLIVSTLANPNVIKLTLPKAKSNTKSKQTVVVSIDAKHEFFVGTNIVSFQNLKLALAPKLAGVVNGTVVINAEKTVPIQYVVDVMQVAHELNARVVLATAHPSQGQ
ncbi:MAG: ExbD/TolR family protein [Chitinophagaceae bacterium]